MVTPGRDSFVFASIILPVRMVWAESVVIDNKANTSNIDFSKLRFFFFTEYSILNIYLFDILHCKSPTFLLQENYTLNKFNARKRFVLVTVHQYLD